MASSSTAPQHAALKALTKANAGSPSRSQWWVTQVQRSAPTLRVLAASLARLGQTDAAAQAIRELLNLEPQLTIVSLRGRLEHMVEGVREPFLDALRLAGSPSRQR